MPKKEEIETKKNVEKTKKATTKITTNKVKVSKSKTKSNKGSASVKKQEIDKKAKKTIEKKASSNKVKNEEKKVNKNNENLDKFKKELTKKVEDAKKTTPKKKKIDNEISIIDRIKNFIAKIAAMQEENLNEEKLKDKTEVEDKKTKVSKGKKVQTTKVEYMLEYYDLPYRYNETIVKILAQTPKKLFVYWDISDNDRDKYIKTFGEDFFYKTYPVLLLYDKDRNKVKEIKIDDFANSWYIDIEDPKTRYTIQLGRKFKEKPSMINFSNVEKNEVILRNDYLPFANSNILEVPNDHVLLERLPEFIKFRNVKTNQETNVDLRSFKDVFGNNYDVKEFYKENYGEEIIDKGIFEENNQDVPLSSSSFK